jgi:GNAT superfamily N-acetyltransferase
MSVPAPIVRFLRAYESLSAVCMSYPWGTAVRNASLPHVYDANRAWVFDAVTPALDELRDAMMAAQRTVPVAFTQVEVLDIDARAGLVDELTTWLGPPPDVFSFMETSVAPPPDLLATPPPMLVAEQPFPDRERWLALIAAGHSDEVPLPAPVLWELASRDTSTLVAAGTRFFTAEQEGEIVAYASLLSLHGVGLIDNVATVPAHRRQGAATAVVAAVVAASAAAENTHTVLFAQEYSDPQRIYGRLGLRTIARAAQFHRDEPSAAAPAAADRALDQPRRAR